MANRGFNQPGIRRSQILRDNADLFVNTMILNLDQLCRNRMNGVYGSDYEIDRDLAKRVFKRVYMNVVIQEACHNGIQRLLWCKIFGYMAYWCGRIGPVRLLGSQMDTSEKILLNARLGVAMGLRFARKADQKLTNRLVSADLFNELTYTVTYRGISAVDCGTMFAAFCH